MTRALPLFAAIVMLGACARETVSPVEPAVSAAIVKTERSCAQDSKFLGRIALTTGDGPTEWWGLTKAGLLAAGVQPSGFTAKIESFFGTSFGSLDAAVVALVDAVRPLDANANGFVCAYELPGTRTSLGDPDFSFYLFRVRDDDK